MEGTMTRHVLVLSAALGTGLIAGTFLAFSSFIMGALGRLPPAQGIAAMQAINIVVINPLFMAVLFGSGALSLYLGYDAWKHWGEAGALPVAAAALSYVVGALAVTMAFNVPLNNALAAVQPASAEGHQLWAVYLDRWTMWNHVRGIAAVVASGLYVWAMRL
jgi:uncharacterized membrane protein